MFLNTLSGRFLILTTIFVMLAEILIFVPSVARFREDFLMSRLERAQIASLALLASDGMITQELEAELLENAGVYNVVLRRDLSRQLVLSSPIPSPIHETFDLRDAGPFELIMDAMGRIIDGEDRVIRVIGDPVREAGLLIELTMPTDSLRAALIDYGLRILILSLVISVITAGLLFFAVRRLLVTPIRNVVSNMQAYAGAPEDARKIIAPSARIKELRDAETAMQSMQTELTGLLKQKERLAQLGGAVAKVSHDLRNILTTAQLFADRIDASGDPTVKRVAPKIVNSITRAVNLCESTLKFGRAEEAAPTLAQIDLTQIANDAVEGERLAITDDLVEINLDMPPGQLVTADPEQLYRVLTNLVRNARQALSATGKPGEITLSAGESGDDCWIRVADTGPGLPLKAKEHLFQPFQGGARKGGSGLGLAISQELIRGHGGHLELEQTGPEGTTFIIQLPKSTALSASAAG